METPCCYPPTDSDQTHPWLMVSQGTKPHTFYSISKNQYFERCVPELCDKQVAPTSYGWLALFDHSISPIHCCLFNSESREKIQLPPIELPPESKRRPFYRCILSKPPNDPDCHVLLLPNDNFLLFCRLGDDKFVRRSNTFGDDYFSIATNFNGKIYAWMRRFVGTCSLVEVDFVGQELILKQLVNDKGQPCQISLPTKGCCFNDYLVESCGELLLVNKVLDWRLQKVKYFKIFKINTVEGELEELRDIGDRTIFVCPCVSMSVSPMNNLKSRGLQKNSIYYTMDDKNLYMYDIENRTKTILKPCPIDEDTWFSMCWIML